MSIIYTLIARQNDVVLVEYTTAAGNFPQITRTILKKIQKNAKLSYSYNTNYFFHYINENDFTYMCMTDSQFSKRVAFCYLADIQERFLEKFTQDQRNSAITFGLNSAFSEIIKTKMTFYNKNPDTDKLAQLKNNLNEAKEIMVENIDKILEREQKVEILVKKTATMNQLATNIKKQAVQVRREAYWKKMKSKLLLGGLVLLAIYVFLSFFCGGLMLSYCF